MDKYYQIPRNTSLTFKFSPQERVPGESRNPIFIYSQQPLTIDLLENEHSLAIFPRYACVERIRCSTMHISAAYISRCSWNGGKEEAVQFRARAGNHDHSKHVHGRTRC